jgi:branched-chain amino acid transport system permease protein
MTYSLIALALVLVYRTTGIFNLAHGQMMLIAAYLLADWGSHPGKSFAGGLTIAVVSTALLAAIFYLGILRWTVGLPHWIAFVATLVLGNAIDAALELIYGGGEYQVVIAGMPKGAVDILGVHIGSAQLIIAGVGFALTAVVILVLRLSKVGVIVRAAGQDAVLASQGGINVRRVYLIAWIIAGVLAAVAGILYGSTTLVDSSMSQIALTALPAMVLGGLDSFEGALVGGILIGVIQGFITIYWGSQFVDVVTYAVLLVVLLLRPQGLFGTREIVKI